MSSAILPASTWGRTIKGTPPRPGTVTHLTVHWVGSSNYNRKKDEIPAGIKQIEQGQFANSSTLGAISYNFLVDKWGRVWEGRGTSYRNAANGASANNLTSMSVCVLVGISDSQVTEEILSGLRTLYQELVRHYGRDLTVQCHSDVRSTACPGPELTSLVRSGRISQGGNVSRIAGSNRYATAEEVSKEAFPNGANVVFVVSGQDFPDALVVSSLAAGKGPVLLTARDKLPQQTQREIQRLKPAKIVIVGGEAAVSAAVADELRKLVP
jgi:hypothetical protein